MGEGKFDRGRYKSLIVAMAAIYMLNWTENTTYGLDLSKDWTNSTLILVETERSSDSISLGYSSLWYDDKHNSIYCFGGFRSFATAILNSLAPPYDSIWGFKPNGKGNVAWYQMVGPNSEIPFPHNIHRIASGTSTSDGMSAYYLGGFLSWETSANGAPGSRIASSGLLMLDFDTLAMTNSSDGGYVGPRLGPNFPPPGAMINVPIYGENGLLVIMPSGSGDPGDFAFNNLTLYDKKTKKWYSQIPSGEIPTPGLVFALSELKGMKTLALRCKSETLSTLSSAPIKACPQN